MSGGRHVHWFTSLWESTSRDATEHRHPCIEDLADGGNCGFALIGKGRSCDGKRSTHRRVNLDALLAKAEARALLPPGRQG